MGSTTNYENEKKKKRNDGMEKGRLANGEAVRCILLAFDGTVDGTFDAWDI